MLLIGCSYCLVAFSCSCWLLLVVVVVGCWLLLVLLLLVVVVVFVVAVVVAVVVVVVAVVVVVVGWSRFCYCVVLLLSLLCVDLCCYCRGYCMCCFVTVCYLGC